MKERERRGGGKERERESERVCESVRLCLYLTMLAWANGSTNTPLGYPSRGVTGQGKANLRVPAYIPPRVTL